MVLFVFVVMMLNISPGRRREGEGLLRLVAVPLLFALALLGLSIYALSQSWHQGAPAGYVDPKAVGMAMYRPYLLGVELVSLILVAGLAAAFHLAPPPRGEERKLRAEAGRAEEVTGV